MEAGPPNPPAHVHRLPPVVRIAVVGLVAAVFLLLVAVGFLTIYVYQANQYVQGRGEFRDRETARLQEQQRRATCDLLDQLPEGGLLDRPRTKYHCGPGIPLEQLSPQEQAQLQGRTQPPAAPPLRATPGVPPPQSAPLGSAARPAPSSPVPPPEPAPEPSPSPSPLVDLGPVTDPICKTLSVCF